MEIIKSIVSWAEAISWGGVAGIWWLGTLIVVLVPAGLYFSIRLRFVQLRSFGHIWSLLFSGVKHDHDDGVSSFQAFATSAAARVGTGNIAGVAVAVSMGGPGAVFWMWVVAVVGMASSFVENSLAQVYKVKTDEHNVYRGGPAYYIARGLGPRFRWLSTAFSFFLVLSFGLVFNTIQADSMTESVRVAFGFEPLIVGGVLTVLAVIIVAGGIRSIGRFAEVVVPVMALGYIGIALFVVLANITEVPGVIATIVKAAFGVEQLTAGGLGAVLANGLKRGLFSNEAGMGSSPNAAAAADVKHPAVQGFVQMGSVFLDTMLICTATASVILLTDAGTAAIGSKPQGVALTQAALTETVGSWGGSFIAIALLFFAFTSVIANYYYAESNVAYLFSRKVGVPVYRVLYAGFLMLGAWVASSEDDSQFELMWQMADVSMGFMATCNLIAILLLTGTAAKVLEDYERQRRNGVESPTFNPEAVGIEGCDPGVWESDSPSPPPS
ncbi:MAG: alanine/glycine:cation symporter family protein [Myxococcota bacterium]